MKLNTFSEFISNNTHTFRKLLTNKSKHIFRVHIKHYWQLEGVTPKQYYTLFQISGNSGIFRELLANNTTHFSRVYIKQCWHFQKSSFQIKLVKTFFRAISRNTDTFRELLPNNIDLFRAHIKQYSNFHRVITKQ